MAIKSKLSFDPKSFLAKVGDGRSAKPARRVANLSECNDATYFGVNEQFACDLHKLLRRDDMIWVHDYHFIPVAHFLRQMGCVNRIVFFCISRGRGRMWRAPCPPTSGFFAASAPMMSLVFRPRLTPIISAIASSPPTPDGSRVLVVRDRWPPDAG
jgi:hypothetical protein